MVQNVGGIDRIARIVIGLLLLAFALRLGFGETGYNWLGWLGVIPLGTAFLGNCPLYSIIGVSTCPAKKG